MRPVTAEISEWASTLSLDAIPREVAERGLLLVRGAVPGPAGATLVIRRSLSEPRRSGE